MRTFHIGQKVKLRKAYINALFPRDRFGVYPAKRVAAEQWEGTVRSFIDSSRSGVWVYPTYPTPIGNFGDLIVGGMVR